MGDPGKGFAISVFLAHACVGQRALKIMALQERAAIGFKAEFMFQPVMDTFKAMFREYETGHAGVTFEHDSVLRGHIAARAATLRTGDLFIWLGWLGSEQVPWASLAKHGVRTVYYRTEPSEPACPSKGWHLSEAWEYTRANVGKCTCSWAPISRYLPPGALTASAGKLPASTSLVFVGNSRFDLAKRGPTYHRRRSRCFHALAKRMPELRAVDNVWSEASFATLMRKHAIYLSFHKGCGLPNQPVEAFRVAKVLSHGRLVIGERSHVADEHEFDQLVTFGNLSQVPYLHRQILQMPLAERTSLAEARSAAFRVRFNPLRLFNTSGVRFMLDSLWMSPAVHGRLLLKENRTARRAAHGTTC